MQKSDFNFIEITLLNGYSFVNMLHTCSRAPFLENTSGELPLYIVLNIEAINVEVISKLVKNCLKYISMLIKHAFLTAIADKIYETMSRNQAKLDRTRKL